MLLSERLKKADDITLMYVSPIVKMNIQNLEMKFILGNTVYLASSSFENTTHISFEDMEVPDDKIHQINEHEFCITLENCDDFKLVATYL